MLHDCLETVLSQYARYDAAFSRRDERALAVIETSDFIDTDPDGTRRNAAQAAENQLRFFSIAEHLNLRSTVQCESPHDGEMHTVARMSLDGAYTPPNSHRHDFSEVYINHDVWRNVNGTWRLASQTTVRLDGVDDGRPVHLILKSSKREMQSS